MLSLLPPLSDRSLTWLRSDASTSSEPLVVALAAALAARRLPAWIERPASIVRSQIVLGGVSEASDAALRTHDDGSTAVVIRALLALIESGGTYVVASRRNSRDAPWDRVGEGDPLVSDAEIAMLERSLDLDEVTEPGAIRRGIRAGLALALTDTASGTGHWRRSWTSWWRTASSHTTMTEPSVVLELVPQDPVDAQALFETWLDADGVARALSMARESSDVRSQFTARRELCAAAFVAREFDRAATARSADEALTHAWSGDEVAPGPAVGSGVDAWRAAADLVRPGLWRVLATETAVRVPQVVDVEQPALMLARAEWQRGSLFLRLVPTDEDRRRRTTFRIVGAEPRVWCFTGVDGAVLDCTSRAQIVTLPMVRADVEFSEGSY